jgi:hypothetical protein
VKRGHCLHNLTRLRLASCEPCDHGGVILQRQRWDTPPCSPQTPPGLRDIYEARFTVHLVFIFVDPLDDPFTLSACPKIRTVMFSYLGDESTFSVSFPFHCDSASLSSPFLLALMRTNRSHRPQLIRANQRRWVSVYVLETMLPSYQPPHDA